MKDVEAEFVIMEYNNRTDYTYSEFASDVGCRASPMSWKKQIDAARVTNPNLPEMDAWGPFNWENCSRPLHAGESPEQLDLIRYEILSYNKGFPNKLMFKGASNDGYYLFRARVISPDFR